MVQGASGGIARKNPSFARAFGSAAEENQESVMPGYTHLQRAQPVTFAHWCMAYYEMLERDFSRLSDANKRMSTCPLGSGHWLVRLTALIVTY